MLPAAGSTTANANATATAASTGITAMLEDLHAGLGAKLLVGGGPYCEERGPPDAAKIWAPRGDCRVLRLFVLLRRGASAKVAASKTKTGHQR